MSQTDRKSVVSKDSVYLRGDPVLQFAGMEAGHSHGADPRNIDVSGGIDCQLIILPKMGSVSPVDERVSFSRSGTGSGGKEDWLRSVTCVVRSQRFPAESIYIWLLLGCRWI